MQVFGNARVLGPQFAGSERVCCSRPHFSVRQPRFGIKTGLPAQGGFSTQRQRAYCYCDGGGGGPRTPWDSTRPTAAGDGRGPRRLPLCLVLFALGVTGLTTPLRASAATRARRSGSDLDLYVNKMSDLLYPILKNLGFSGVMGAMAALAFKAVGRACAVAVGFVFVLIQVLAFAGYLRMDWTRVHSDVVRTCDINKDGKLDATDLRAALASVLAILSQGVPSAGGFCAGFLFGLRMG